MTNESSRPVIKSGSALVSSQIVLMLFNLLFTIYLLRLLSKTDIAVTALLDILVSVMAFSDMGLLAVAIQQAPSRLQSAGDREQAVALIKCALIYRSLAMIVMGAVAIIFAPSISQVLLKTPDYAWAVIILVPGAFGTIGFNSLQVIAQIKNDFYLVARWNLVSGLLRPILSIAGYLVFGLPGLLAGILASIYISLIGVSWSLRDLIFNSVAPAPFWSTFRYGIPLYIRNFLRFGFLQYDQLVVATLLTPDILATYSVVRRLTKFIFLITDSFQSPITMRMASLRHEPDELQATFFRKATRYMTYLVLPLSVFLASMSPWIIQLYGGEKYAHEWPLLIMLTIAQVAYTLFDLFGNAVFARLQPIKALVMDGLVGGINYLLAPIFLVMLGKYGIAWGQILGFTAGIGLAHYLLKGKAAFQFDWSGLKTLGVPLIVTSAFIVTGHFLFTAWWGMPTIAALAGLLFAYLALRRISEDEWGQIMSISPQSLVPIIQKVQRWRR